jgi:deoxyribodipyrimidine photolyase
MTKKYQLALHIFRRDLRLLTIQHGALSLAAAVIPCLFLIRIENNAYKSDHCIQFMAHSQELAALARKKWPLYFLRYSEEVIQHY